MRLSQLINTIGQIYRAEHVGLMRGVARHFAWQIRRCTGAFPVDLTFSQSRLRAERACAVGALVNCLGMYDYNNMNLIKLLLTCEDSVFFDVGANIGSYALIASEQAGRVVCFEPNPTAFRCLCENLSLNGRDNVNAINCAISDKNGVVLLTDGSESSTSRVLSEPSNGEKTIEVDSITLDEACRRLSLAPTVLKIDVEGNEKAVLDGFREGAGTAHIFLIEEGERDEIRNHRVLAEFLGPWYFNFNSRKFAQAPQKRAEDPVFVSRNAVSRLAGLGLTLPVGQMSNRGARAARADGGT